MITYLLCRTVQDWVKSCDYGLFVCMTWPKQPTLIVWFLEPSGGHKLLSWYSFHCKRSYDQPQVAKDHTLKSGHRILFVQVQKDIISSLIILSNSNIH